MEAQFFAGVVAAIAVSGMVWYVLKRKKEADARKGGSVGRGGSGDGKTQKK